MRFKLVCWNLGKISIILSITMLLPLIWAIVKSEECVYSLLFTLMLSLAIGAIFILLFRGSRKQTLRKREGYALVTFGWILAAVLGMLPYIWSGMIPDLAGAFFESMSGFTTTGATVLNDIESNPESLLIWRSITHWLGGMGIVVLVVALSTHSKGSSNLFNAETPGSTHTDRLTPKISDTSLIMWSTYCGLTIILIIILMLEGMDLFDAICHSFSTVATGGFSTKNASIAAYDSIAIQWTIIIFMFICGANIAYLYFLAVKRKNYYLKQEEFQVYTFVAGAATIAVAIVLLANNYFGNANFEYYMRHACFQVVSILTTTGFITDNYSYWPMMAKIVILMMFFIGGCFGSTAGSVKVPRWIIAVKGMFCQLFATVHPRAVANVRLNNRIVPPDSVSSTLNYMLMFILLIFVSGVLISFTGFPFCDGIVASVACITNSGPSFGVIGATGSYSMLSGFSKIVLSMLMLIGRLEVYTVFVLFLPSVWKK